MNDEQFRRWIARVYSTADYEIDCDQVRELVAAYVEAEINDETLDPEYAEVRHHLEQCNDCSDLYESLYRVASLEASGELPATSELLSDWGLESG